MRRTNTISSVSSINKSAVTENSILFGSDRVKDGQKFVTTEGFKEDNFDSEVS